MAAIRSAGASGHHTTAALRNCSIIALWCWVRTWNSASSSTVSTVSELGDSSKPQQPRRNGTTECREAQGVERQQSTQELTPTDRRASIGRRAAYGVFLGERAMQVDDVLALPWRQFPRRPWQGELLG